LPAMKEAKVSHNYFGEVHVGDRYSANQAGAMGPGAHAYPFGEDRGDKCPVLAVCSVETAALLVLLAGPAGARVIAPELMRGCGRGRQAAPAMPDPPGI
jgi:hypothetical protein